MSKKVIVVGAGCSGLAAAHTLFSAGCDVQVFEALPKSGGRMTCYKWGGFSVDEAAQMVAPDYRATYALCDELGLREEFFDADLDGLKIYFENGEDKGWVSPNPYSTEPLDIKWKEYMGLEQFDAFIQWVIDNAKGKMYEGSVDWMAPVDDPEGPDFGQFVKENFGEKVLECFAQPVFSALGLDIPENVSLGFGLQIMWTVIRTDCQSITRGLGRISETICEELGDRVKTGTPVTEIVIENGVAKGVKTADGYYEADAVVCATPAQVALRIIPGLPPVMHEALSKVDYCPAIHNIILLDKVMAKKGLDGGFIPRFTGDMSTVLFNSLRSPSLVRDENSEAINIFYFAEKCRELWDKSDDEILEYSMYILRKYFEGTPDEILKSHIIRFPYSNYVMPKGCATNMKHMRENHYKDVEGLFLCGEYMFTGSFESAINAGRRAAYTLLGEIEHV